MATKRMVTRRQCQKDSMLASRNECDSPMKKGRTSVHPGEDEHNPVDSATTSLNKSFPQDHDVSVKKMNKKTSSRIDNTGKQRQTLSERVVNTFKATEPPQKASEVKKREHVAVVETRSGNARGAGEHDSPILIDTPAVEEQRPPVGKRGAQGDNTIQGDITQEEISQLEEQTSVEEMMCEEALTAALPPLLKQDYYIHHHPHYYNKHFSFDTSMEIEPWREVRSRTARQLPPEVVDIDSDVDEFHTNVYAHNIIEYLKQKELQSPLPPNFLDSSPEVTPKMRGVLMDWLIQVQDHEELEEETLHLCVALIDRYLAAVRVHMPRLQLVGITCLLIATKFLERFAPQISTLCHLTADSFKPKQVVRHEMQVLMTLNFDLSIPVSVTFMRRFLQVHDEQQPPEVTSLAYYILDLSVTNAKMASMTPSMVAASAIYLARRLVLGTGQAWTASLAHYTSFHNLSELCDVVNELANLVYKAPASKFQGARKKYNTELHNFVSSSRITSPETVESHFLEEVTAS